MPQPQSFFEDRFYGIDRRQDPDKISEGQSPLCLNVELSKFGSVKKRNGTKIIGQNLGDNNISQSLINFIKNDQTNQLYRVKNGAIEKLNIDTWTAIGTGLFDATQNVASIQFNNQIYFSSLTGNLVSVSNLDIVSTVGGTTNPITGTCLGVSQGCLFIGGVSFGGNQYLDRVYYSRFDLDTRLPTDIFWEEEETGLADSTRFFRVEGGIVQSIVSFPSKNRLIVFTDTKAYSFDLKQVESNPFVALQEVFQIGCCGSQASVVVDDILYWMDKEGKIWAWAGSNTAPVGISYSIDDDNLGDSIISLIDKTSENLSKVCALGLGKKVLFSVGRLVIDNISLNSAVIKLFISPAGNQANFSIDNFTSRFYCGCVAQIDGIQTIIAGDNNNTLQLYTGIDDNQGGEVLEIDSFYRTKSYNFDESFVDKKIEAVLVKFRTTSQLNNYLVVKVALNGSKKYQTITDPVNSINTGGIINMYSANPNLETQAVKKAIIPSDLKGREFSFEFSNKTLNQTFEITGFGFGSYSTSDPNIPLENE